MRPAVRRLIGVFLVLHGLAHALPGMRAAQAASAWLEPGVGRGSALLLAVVTLLWALAMPGFVAAGFGALGAAAFRRHWRMIAAVAALASFLLFMMLRPPLTLLGGLIDLAILFGLAGGRAGAAPAAVRPLHRKEATR